MFINKDTILKQKKTDFENVDVSEFFGKDAKIRINVLSAFERDQFDVLSLDDNGKTTNVNFRARLVVLTASDDSGAPIFDEFDITKLGNQSGVLVSKLHDVAWRINKMGNTDQEVVQEAKNS